MPMPGIFILGFIVFVVVAILASMYGHRKRKEREAALSQLADELGWSFSTLRDYDLDSRYAQFSVFTRGDSRYGYNTFRGAIQRDGQTWPAVMGDYHYKTTSGTGKNRRTTTHHFSYLLVQTPYVLAGNLQIRREHLFDRMASFIGFDDIDFESAEFSDKFHVKSADKRFAYDVIHPRMMDFLLASTPPTIQFELGCCCIHTNGKTWQPHDFRRHKSWMEEFFTLWPSHVTANLQS